MQRREITELHRLRLLGEDPPGLDQLFGGLLLAHRIDHLGTSQSFGLGLFGNRAHHGLVEVDILDLDRGYLDPPDVGLPVEDLLDVGGQLVSFRKHLVEFVLAEHGAQRGLRELAGGGHVIPDLDDGALGIENAKVEHGVDLDRDVVARNHVLRRHDLDHHPEINLHELLHDGNEDDEARPLHPGEASECEDDTALVFPQDPNGLGEKYDDEQRNRRIGQVVEHHDASPSLVAAGARRTTSVKSTMLDTSTTSPGLKASTLRACQRSPCAKTCPSFSFQSRTSAGRPLMACAPTLAGPRRARRIEPSTTRTRPVNIATTMAMTDHDSR